jgi:exosortase
MRHQDGAVEPVTTAVASMPKTAGAPGSEGSARAGEPGGAGAPTLLGRMDGPAWVMAGVLAAAFVGLFHLVLASQHKWSMQETADWGHAWLVPGISGYLIYQQREALARVGLTRFWPGLILLLAGIVSYIFGAVGVRNHMFQGWAMVLTLLGLVLLMLGPAAARYLVLPIGYLVCGISVAPMLMTRITTVLQQIASEGSYLMLQMMGITADMAGTTITVYSRGGEAHPLNIAEACSGLRMLIAFVALGAAIALVACRHWWQRVALVAMAVPVALFINIVRVVVLAIASFFNSDLAAGEAHTFIGTLLLVPGLVLYLAILWVLGRIITEPEAGAGARPAAGPAVAGGVGASSPAREARRGSPWRRLLSPAFLASVLLLGGTAVAFPAISASLSIHLTKKPIQAEGGRTLGSLPAETPRWRRIGEDRQENEATIEVLGTRNYLNRTYVSKEPGADGTPIVLDLHAAYYTGMVDTVPHVPERCFVGGGMDIAGPSREVPLPMDQSGWIVDREVPPGLLGRVFTARLSNDPRYTDGFGQRVRMPLAPEALPEDRWGAREKVPIRLRVTPFAEPGSARLFHAGYFFIANGQTIASAEGVRGTAFDLREEYAYYLKVQVGSAAVRSAEELGVQAASLLDDLMPEMMRCVPDWVRVQAGEYPPDNPRRAGAAATAP